MQPELIETILVDAQRRMPLLARHLKRLEAPARRWTMPGPAPPSRPTSWSPPWPCPRPARTGCACWWRATAAAASRPPPAAAAGRAVMLAPEALRSSEPLLRYKTTHRPWYTKTISGCRPTRTCSTCST